MSGLLAVQMGLKGELGLDEIAQAVGRSHATIQAWFDTYHQGGVDASNQRIQKFAP